MSCEWSGRSKLMHDYKKGCVTTPWCKEIAVERGRSIRLKFSLALFRFSLLRFTQIHFYNFFEFQYSNYQSSLQISLHNQNFIISDCLEQCSCYCFIILYKNSFYFPEYLGKCICFNCILYLTNIANFYQNLLG